MASMIDYDEYECDRCGHIGIIPDGDLDYICPECDYEGSLYDDEDDCFDDLDEIDNF